MPESKAHWSLYLYCLFLLVPLYWLVSMAVKSNRDILGGLELVPANPTLANFTEIFTNPAWYQAFFNSLAYVGINTALTLSIALPAAYAFSRYRFLGDRQLFFWLLTNRMAPPAVFLLPFLQLYSSCSGSDFCYSWYGQVQSRTARTPTLEYRSKSIETTNDLRLICSCPSYRESACAVCRAVGSRGVHRL